MSQIIVDPEPLSPSFLPEKLLHRDREYSQLIGNMKNRINTLVFGPIGSGKTALVKLAMKEFRDVLYIDCLLYSTEYGVLKEMIPSNRFIISRSNYDLFKELQKIAREKKLVVCLDNFNHLKQMDIVKKIISLGICTILIGRLERNSPSLNQNMTSHFPDLIKLEEYSIGQTFDILKDRARIALSESSYEERTLQRIAEKIGGNITMAISILKALAVKSETGDKYAINETDLEGLLPNVDSLDELNNDERTIYKILSEQKSLPSNALYTAYAECAKHPKCERSFRNYLENLQSKGLVKAIGEKKGRIYEIMDSEANPDREIRGFEGNENGFEFEG